MGLDRVRAVAQAMGLGRPAPCVITVGGTNGKGSTVAFLEAIARAAGLRVGAYTSPHLWRFNERIRIDGAEADDAAIVSAAAAIFFVFGFTQLMDGVQSVSLGALRGMLDNDYPIRVSLVSYWLIALPLSAVMGFAADLGAPGIWAGFGIGLSVAAVALAWRFWRLSHRAVPPAEFDE